MVTKSGRHVKPKVIPDSVHFSSNVELEENSEQGNEINNTDTPTSKAPNQANQAPAPQQAKASDRPTLPALAEDADSVLARTEMLLVSNIRLTFQTRN